MKKETKIVILCCLVYFTSYITRINYGAVIVELVDSLAISSSVAGVALTCSFISYGIGQIISGFLGDKVKTTILIATGLIVSSSANLFVGIVENINVIIVVWTINGFAQSLMWPPLVKIMTSNLNPEQYKKGCALVTISASVATVLIYIISPLLISIFNYKAVFIFSCILGISTLIVWIIATKNISTDKCSVVKISNNKASPPLTKVILSTGIIPIMIVIVLQGMLRDGITTWMPSFINDNFNMSTSFSILTTTILPIFCILSIWTTRFANKKVKNDIALSSIIWGLSIFSATILFIFIDNITVAVIAMAILTASMHGINLLLIGNLPAKFLKYGKVSTMSGILNSCTYIGSALSTYGIAKLCESFGWSITILVWLAISILGFFLCFISIKKYNGL